MYKYIYKPRNLIKKFNQSDIHIENINLIKNEDKNPMFNFSIYNH